MTPEEQFTQINNALQSLTETQARHDVQIGELIVQTDKNTAGIRDLIVVSRTFLNSQKEVTGQIQQLREAQQARDEKYDREMAELRELHKDTDEKLNALIDTVDRIIRRDNGKGTPE